MRFFSEGPNIPDQLLEDRDNGEVVFFCGAGVSIPSGLPDFLQLTWKVLDRLRVPADPSHPLRKSFKLRNKGTKMVGAKKRLDEIFDDILEEYDRDHVNEAVAKELATPATADVAREHGIIARLSTSADRKPQIVTTNFDHLFERSGAIGDKEYFEPHNLPNLDGGRPISGLTYLHGRIQTDGAGSQNFILSGDDFGLAYMYETSTTRFLRNLFENYTVVLLGYKAEDPPVWYLFKGMKRASKRHSFRLYAFERGAKEEVEAKWSKLGVKGIAYSGKGENHSRLWKSLNAWAIRADDPVAWMSGVIEQARRGPSVLHAYERGQVAHVVRSDLGAKAFADAKPVPPAEWLCVFDSGCRLANPENDFGKNGNFSPRDHYALDDDPPEPSAENSRQGSASDNLIAWRIGDERPTLNLRLSGRAIRGFEELPPRLFHLCRWIAANSPDPIVAWWATLECRLHPRLVRMIASHLDSENHVPDQARRIWRLIFEALDHDGKRDLDMNWYAMLRRVEREGWTSGTLGALQKLTEPYIKLDPPTGRSRVEPPTIPWSEIDQCDIARFDVEFPNQNSDPPNVPDEAVCAAFLHASRNLLKGLERLEEVGRRWFHQVTLYHEDSGPEDRFRTSEAKFALWLAELMKRTAQLDPGRVSAEISLWPSDDWIILNKFRLFAWNQPEVFSGDQVAANLMAMDQDAFWNIDNKREFLFLLRDRWHDFPDQDKDRLLARLLKGSDTGPDAERPDSDKIRDIDIATRILWLKQQGRAISSDVSNQVSKIQERIPGWNDDRISKAADSREVRAGSVEIDTDPSVLDGVPLSRLAETALENTHFPIDGFTEYCPFEGLVLENPGRALSALVFIGRKKQYPTKLWEALLRKWPSDAPARATRIFCERLRQLPDEVIKNNAYAVGSWMRDKLPAIAVGDLSFALNLFDDLLKSLMDGGPDTARSALGEISISGRVVQRSRRIMDYAINAPIGHATQGLISIIEARQLPQAQGLPEEFATRLEKLLSAPGEGSDHAVCLLAQRYYLFHDIAPDWTEALMVPWFALDHESSESAWNGLFHGYTAVKPDLFEAIKTPFLKLYQRMYDWHWSDDEYRRVHTWLIKATIWRRSDPRYISLEEASMAVRELSKNGLTDIIHHLELVGQSNENGWAELVVPLLRDLWPKDKKYRTESASTAFLSMLGDSGNDFPLVFGAVRSHLCRIRREYFSLYRFHSVHAGEEESITSRFPAEVLDLMDLVVSDDSREIPYDLGEVLALISEKRPELARDRRYRRLQGLLAAM